MNNKTLTRINLLLELIDNILVHDINYEKKTDTLKRKNGATTYCQFESAEQLKKFRRIFFICFHIDDADYQRYFPENKFGLCKKTIIQKALTYFRERGIDFISLIKAVCKDEKEFEEKILDAINDFLLPTAFLPVKSKEDKNAPPSFGKYDIIYSYYEEALRNIKITLVKFRSLRMLQFSAPTCEIIDSVYKHREQCNYKVLINLSDLKLDLHYVPKWEPDYVEIPQNLNKKLKEFNDFLDKIEQKTPFERMVEGFIPLLPNNSPPSFQLEDIISESDTDPIRYTLSPDNLYYSQFYPRKLEYITHLDEESIKEEYPDASTHEKLERAIFQKAAKDIKIFFESRIKSNYQNIAHYIESVLSGLMKFDLNELISMNPTNKENCDIALNAFHLPSDEIYSILGTYENDQSTILLLVYHSIQGGLFSFLRTLHVTGPHFAIKFNEYLDIKTLAEHKKIVDHFICSSNFASVISIQQNETEAIKQQKEQDRTLEQLARDNLKINEINHRYNELFIIFKKEISKYYDQLQHPVPEQDPFRNFNCTNFNIQDPDYPIALPLLD